GRRRPPRRRASRRLLWTGLAVVVLATAGTAAVWAFSGARLVPDASALGRVELQPFAGSLVSVRARAAEGRTIPLVVSHGRLTPRVPVGSGEQISLSITVRRPGWESWALGDVRRETLTVRTPVAEVVNRWVTVAHGTRARVRFTAAVDRVSLPGAAAAGR